MDHKNYKIKEYYLSKIILRKNTSLFYFEGFFFAYQPESLLFTIVNQD